MKKLFISSAILLILVLFFLGVYNFAFKRGKEQVSNTPAQPQQPQIKNTEAKQDNAQKLIAISTQPVLGPYYDKSNQLIIYYSGLDGTVWNMGADGSNKEIIYDTKLEGLKNVIWASDKSKVLTVFDKNGTLSFFQYDYKLKKGTALKSGLDNAIWDNLGSKIIYKFYDEKIKSRTLNIANPDGSNWQKITDIEDKEIMIATIPSTSYVSYWNKPEFSKETHLYMISTTGGEKATLLSGRYGADYLWAPDGKKALVSSLSEDKRIIQLGLITIDGQYSDLNVPTFVSKCTWSSDSNNIYCALPGNIPESAMLPDDYINKKFYTNDTFWKIETKTGKKERIIEASDIPGKYDSSDIFLSDSENLLYFVNREDGKLYRIKM